MQRLGDILWVKLRGSSWWPAQIVDENTVSRTDKPIKRWKNDVLVRLYGSYKYIYANSELCLSEFEKVLVRNNGSHEVILMKALEQETMHLKSGGSLGQGSKAKGKNDILLRDGSPETKNKKQKLDKDVTESETNTANMESLETHGKMTKRRKKVMQILGLTAPSGSPFHRSRFVPPSPVLF